MNFDLTEDEEMLKALVERFVADRYDIERRRGYMASDLGFSRENWRLLGELGLIAAPFAEQDGGMNLDATAIAAVFEALGRGFVAEPLIENVLLAARLFATTAPEALREQWLHRFVSGEARVAFAHAETGARPGRPWVETTAGACGEGVRLAGEKAYVPAGGGVDGFIVSARADGAGPAADGFGLYFVPAGEQGLTVRDWRMADGTVAVSLTLDNVAVPPGNILSGGVAEVKQGEVLANLARVAEALGIMERLFAETREYLLTRQQFGVRLASFQALQHRMVAQYAAIEQSRALLNLALISWDTPGFARAVQGARAFIGDASIDLGHEMIQMHGGMGVTDELSIGHGHKRLLVLSRWPDDPASALESFACLADS
ncbi:MAG: acyl-CoA/acyl-ACP dehydrogenase [Novosphingobium sp.]|jgi:alkylation response protein AidB-like acyl-CoA dehydrogenase|nr:acyl-CoA/acyl-ACP dehydrogenase [Novosphingobium sp.]